MAGSSQEDRFAEAEQVLGEWLGRRADGGAEGFETLVGAHAGLARELRELGAFCGEVDSALGAGKRVLAEQQAEVERLLALIGASPEFESRYEVEGEVGRGGMGVVLAVRDKKLDRPLAMKVIRGHATGTLTNKTTPTGPRQLARFLGEARITSRLEHPGIVPVHEMGVDPRGLAYFTMKLVRGKTLAHALERCSAGDPEWNLGRILGVLQRVCEAVAFAHERGVVHRDLKPSNVMLGDFGEVYVMDWGLARLREQPEEEASQREPSARARSADPTTTGEGAVLGTPAYMPPEQAAGRLAEIGPHSDVYAIGAMLHHLIAGHAPYCRPGESRNGVQILARIAQGPPAPIAGRDAPPELVAICHRAMAYDWRQRYPSVRELSAELTAFLEGRVVKSYASGPWAEARKWIQRNRALAGAVAATFLAVLVGAVAFAVKAREAERSADALKALNVELRGTNQELVLAREEAVEAARREKDRAEEVLQLSTLQDLDLLREEERELWPLRPELAPRLQAWIDRARELVATLPERRAELARFVNPAEVEARRRALERRRGGRAAAAEADPSPRFSFESDLRAAEELNAEAWSLVDPATRVWGEEERALALSLEARRRAEDLRDNAADEATKKAWSKLLAESGDTVAWTYFALGQDEQALEAGGAALNAAPEDRTAEFEGYLVKLEAAVDAAHSEAGLRAEEGALGELEARLSQLDEKYQMRRDKWSWWCRELGRAVESLETLEPELDGGEFSEGHWSVPKRLSFLSQTSADVAAPSAWELALPKIRAAYPGLAVGPQFALLPLGPDPLSGLWEFADLQTGAPPERDAEGRLRISADTGLVFVLLPGGEFSMGAQRADSAAENYDPDAAQDEGPVRRVRLSPFFLSKYEMTQGQWQRLTGKNPSVYHAGNYAKAFLRSGRPFDGLHPVENVSWVDGNRVCRAHGFLLPSEAQWEYAARAENPEPWWFDDDPALLSETGNVLDQWARDNLGKPGLSYEPWNDGATVHAPVGSHEPNPFGLHDLLGNVWEWCLDQELLYPPAEGTVSDPVLQGSNPQSRRRRGGSCGSPALDTRSASRGNAPAASANFETGLRPARRVE